MKSLLALKAFATNALATVGSTAAGKAVIVATTVVVAGTSTAGVASMTAQQNKASEVQTEVAAEVDESVAADADVMAIDDMNVSAAASDVVPDATIATEDNPVIGHRICFCGAGVAILEKTGLDEAVWAWHILEAHGVKYDKFHNVRHTDAYGDDDPLMENVKDPVKPAEKPGQEENDKPEAEEPVEKPEVDAPVVDNGNVNKPVEDNKVEVENDADKKAEEEAKKKAEEEAAKKAEEEAKKKAEEEAKKKAEEEAAKKAAEEAARKQAEKEALRKRLEATAESSNSTISEETYEYLLSDEMFEQTKVAQDAVDAEAARQEAILKAYEEQCQREREAREAERAAREAEQAELEALRAQGLIP